MGDSEEDLAKLEAQQRTMTWVIAGMFLFLVIVMVLTGGYILRELNTTQNKFSERVANKVVKTIETVEKSGLLTEILVGMKKVGKAAAESTVRRLDPSK